MIAGFSGHLLPQDFVEGRLGNPVRLAFGAEMQRVLTRWRATTNMLGPASGLRALVDGAALPLIDSLGIASAGTVAIGNQSDSATVSCRAGAEAVVLIIAPWGASLNRCWRAAVVEALRTGAAWCLLFNGTHLRLIRPSRLFSRRYVELELDAVADDPRTAAALWMIFRRARTRRRQRDAGCTEDAARIGRPACR